MSIRRFLVVSAAALGAAGAQAQEAQPETPQQIEGRRSAFVQGTLNVAAGERATLRH